MSTYERQCRWLVAAFPPDFRAGCTEDLVSTLLDDAPVGARTVSLRTTFDLLTAGCRMRAMRSGAGRGVGRGAAEGLVLAAIIGLGLQAALAVASAVYQAEHGIVFYVPAIFYGHYQNFLASKSLTTWVVLALVSTTAFTAAVRGAWRLAGALSAAASAYTITVAVTSALLTPRLTETGSTPPPGFGPAAFRDMRFIATPGLLTIGAVAAVLAVVVGVRRRTLRSAGPRSAWWLVPASILAAVFSAVGDGSGAQGPASNLHTDYPPQGGILTVLQCLLAAAVVIGFVWSFLDPRVGWAVAILTIPFCRLPDQRSHHR